MNPIWPQFGGGWTALTSIEVSVWDGSKTSTSDKSQPIFTKLSPDDFAKQNGSVLSWEAVSPNLRTGNVSSKVIHSISRLDVYQFIGDSRDFCYGTFLIKTPDSSFLLKKMMSSCSLLRSRWNLHKETETNNIKSKKFKKFLPIFILLKNDESLLRNDFQVLEEPMCALLHHH